VTIRGLEVLALLLAIPAATIAQTPDALDWQGKLKFHIDSSYGPSALLGLAAYAAVLQEARSPDEWGEGGSAYGKRVASMAGWAGVHTALAFGLDSTLHQDPRYFRSGGEGVWRRMGHALRGTLLTRTDKGGETISTWRIGSAYGSAFLSNLWYPDRLDNVKLGLTQGSVSMGFGLASNLALEFWPDVKRKVFHRKVAP
jgi:hypothetical protein